MAWAAVVKGGVSLVTGILGSKSSKKASDQQASAMRYEAELAYKQAQEAARRADKAAQEAARRADELQKRADVQSAQASADERETLAQLIIDARREADEAKLVSDEARNNFNVVSQDYIEKTEEYLATGDPTTQLAEELFGKNFEFGQEQYDLWENTFGSIEKNTAEFYKTLTPEHIAVTGVEKFQQQFETSMQRMHETFAQRGIKPSSGIAQSLKAQAELGAAETRAGIRRDAPLQAARASENFLQLGLQRDPTNLVSGSFEQQIKNLYGQSALGQQLLSNLLGSSLGQTGKFAELDFQSLIEGKKTEVDAEKLAAESAVDKSKVATGFSNEAALVVGEQLSQTELAGNRQAAEASYKQLVTAGQHTDLLTDLANAAADKSSEAWKNAVGALDAALQAGGLSSGVAGGVAAIAPLIGELALGGRTDSGRFNPEVKLKSDTTGSTEKTVATGLEGSTETKGSSLIPADKDVKGESLIPDAEVRDEDTRKQKEEAEAAAKVKTQEDTAAKAKEDAAIAEEAEKRAKERVEMEDTTIRTKAKENSEKKIEKSKTSLSPLEEYEKRGGVSAW